MDNISEEQLTQIKEFLFESGLSYEELETELVDHLLCDVEIYMDKGLSFEQALDKVKNDVPKNEFRTIQNDIMELLNKKLRLTTVMLAISSLLFLLSAAFESLGLPGENVFSTCAGVSIALIICASIFMDFSTSRQTEGKWTVEIFITLLIALIIPLIFIYQKWPGVLQMSCLSMLAYIHFLPKISLSQIDLGDRMNNLLTLIRINRKNIEWAIVIVMAIQIVIVITIKSVYRNEFANINFISFALNPWMFLALAVLIFVFYNNRVFRIYLFLLEVFLLFQYIIR